MENEEDLASADSNGIADMMTPQNTVPRTEKSRINGESLEVGYIFLREGAALP